LKKNINITEKFAQIRTQSSKANYDNHATGCPTNHIEINGVPKFLPGQRLD